jgi:flagellar hook protein FlgE
MIDSIYIAMSGLDGHQRGLKVISNNVANMNTTGFKGASLNFTDVLGGGAEGAGYSASGNGTGQGLAASQTLLDMRAGELRQTGRDLDLALQGNGFFVMQDDTGALRYTRAGDFEFDSDGALVGRGHGMKVMGRDANGNLVPIKLDGLKLNAPKASTEIVLTGNLSSTDTDHTIDALVVYDKLGGAHTLRLQLTNNSSTTPGSWLVAVFEGTEKIGEGELEFENGLPAPGSSPLALALALQGADPADIQLVLGSDVTGFSSGTTSSLGLKSQDGHGLGQISSLKFDEAGVLKITYSNGEKADGPRLVLAQLRDETALEAVGDALFSYDAKEPALLREAGDDLKISGQALELSNVDLTEEFSALILMQRGYQASSQVLSTANDMLQELFEMKGRR